MKKLISLFALCSLVACKSTNDGTTPTPTVTPVDTVIKAAVDPALPETIGFFLDNWQAKSYVAPSYEDASVPQVALNTVTVDASEVITKIPSQIFGHNANTWMGTFVDQPSFMTDITNLKPNVIRWPAGSGSDIYFWNAKPVGTSSQTPDASYMNQWGVPTQYLDKDGVKQPMQFFYGQTTDNWRASLSNYYDMLRMSNNKGVITINYGFARYGTSKNPVATAAHLAADWVRYDKGRTEYWEIGNENYADWEMGYRIDVSKNQDGQPEFLTGDLYAKHFKVYADSMRKAAAEVGAKIKIGAVMQESKTQSWQTITTKTWNATMLPTIGNTLDFFIVHNYITPYGEASTVKTIVNSALEVPTTMMNFVKSEIATNAGVQKPIAFTEWNMWAQNLKQQVSNISGLFAIIVQGESIKNKYGMALRWDLLNGWQNGDDHGLFSDGGNSDDPRWNPRPSFYYMYYFQKTIGDRLVASKLSTTTNDIVSYASTFSSGQVGVTLLNTSSTAQTYEVILKNVRVGSRFYWYTLQGSNDNGDFSRKVLVNGVGPTGAAGGPATYNTIKAKSGLTSGGIKVVIPAYGATCLMIDKK
jgi:hypothetical protein